MAEETKEETKKEEVQVPAKFEKLVGEIEKMSVLDLAELVKVLEEKFGVSAAAPVAVAPAAGGAAAEPAEEKTAFIGDQYFEGRPQLIHSYKGGNSFEHVKTLTKMLETLDAEKFCSGHGKIVGREEIKNHISQMQERQEKIKSLMDKNKSYEEIKSEFEENEARLVESIYNEIKAGFL